MKTFTEPFRIPCPLPCGNHGRRGRRRQRLPLRLSMRRIRPTGGRASIRSIPLMSALVAEGADVDPWRFVPNGDDTAVLPVPGLFVQVAGCAGYAATRSEDLVDQIRIMIDAIGAEGAPADHPSGDGPLVCNRAEHSRRHRDVRVEAHFNRSRKRGHVCARRHLTPAAFRQRDAAHGQPRDPRNRKNPGRVAVCHGCPLHPGFCGCPYAYACGAGALIRPPRRCASGG